MKNKTSLWSQAVKKYNAIKIFVKRVLLLIIDDPLSFVIHMLIMMEVHWHPVMLQSLSRIIIPQGDY